MNVKLIGKTLFALLLAAGCKPGSGKAPDTPEKVRIISTAPALTELICAVGASETLAGRTDVCNYPPEVTQYTPVTGKFAMPSIEQVIVLKPTHLLECFLVNPAQKVNLERFGIKVEHIPCSRMADIAPAIRRTGVITGHRESAEKLACELELDLAKLRSDADARQRTPRTLILLDHLTPITCGTNTFVSEMVSLAGANNIATSLKKEYDNISLEWIIERDPELIICFFDLKADPVKFFQSRTGWKSIRAVREGRIIVPGKTDAICRPGPRVVEGIKELRECIEDCSVNTNGMRIL
jgi:iron complex transport system substrate-binding protein